MASFRISKLQAPSSSLIRFLRCQIDEICLFTPNSGSWPACKLRALTSRLKILQVEEKAGDQGLRPGIHDTRRLKASLLGLEHALFSSISRKHSKGVPAAFLNFPSLCVTSQSVQRLPCASSWRPQLWLQRLLSTKPRQVRSTFNSSGLPPFSDTNVDHSTPILGRSKPANELKLRCTQFDENGNVTLVNGEYKKQDLIQEYKLLPRDLRKIDSSMLPHILVRQSAILINLLHLRVLIRHDRVLVFDVYGSTDSYSQSIFMYDLEHKLRQKENPRQAGSLPYEFRALEAVLISVTSGLEQEFEQVRVPVVRVLRGLEEDIDREKLRHLLIYSKRLGTFEQRARLVRDAIEDILEEDDDLAAMYLTETSQATERGEDDHTEVEMLLESYHKVCDEIVQASSNLVSNIRNTEEIVKAILDSNRNALMLLDLKFSIGTLGIGSGAFVAALYGMNLKNFLEESSIGFLGVSGFSFLFAMIVCGYGLTKLRKVQRVSMWGEQGRRNRGSWRDIDPMPPLPGETGRQRWQRLQDARRQARKRDQVGLDDSLDISIR